MKVGAHLLRYQPGVWLGVRPQTSEVIVGTDNGVFKARSVRRLPDSEKWCAETLKNITGTPWKPSDYDDSDKIRVRMPEPVVLEPEAITRGGDVEPRRFKIEKRDLEKYGHTRHCPGCYASLNKKGHKPHTVQCRARMMIDMEKDDIDSKRVEEHRDKENRWIEQQHDLGKTESPEVAETPTNEPNESVRIDHEPNTLRGEVVMDLDPLDDTTDFYKEVDEAQDNWAADNCADDDELMNSIEQIDNVMSIIESVVKPEAFEDSKMLIEVLRLANSMGQPNVAEVYSPPRVTSLAERFGLLPGFALDLTTTDPEDSMPWDFNLEHKRVRALEMVRKYKPRLLIGSPMCKAFSILMNLNRRRMGKEKYEEMMRLAISHIEFSITLYREQLNNGRYFLHEHPATAGSWNLPCMKNLLEEKGVMRVVGDMCRFGMTSRDASGEGLVMKPTGYMTNSPFIGEELGIRCTKDHRHIHLIGGRARAAEVYPAELCIAILKGLKAQLVEGRSLRPDEPLLSV